METVVAQEVAVEQHWRSRGYQRMEVRSGRWRGTTMPAGARVYVALAPPELPHCAVALGANDSLEPLQVLAQEVADVELVSRGGSVWASGPATAAVAAAVDSWMAGYELRVLGRNGDWLHLTTALASPSAQAVGEMRARLIQSTAAGHIEHRQDALTPPAATDDAVARLLEEADSEWKAVRRLLALCAAAPDEFLPHFQAISYPPYQVAFVLELEKRLLARDLTTDELDELSFALSQTADDCRHWLIEEGIPLAFPGPTGPLVNALRTAAGLPDPNA